MKLVARHERGDNATLDQIGYTQTMLRYVCCLLGNSQASEFYMPTFGTLCLFYFLRQVDVKNSSHLPAYENGTDRVFRNVGI